MKYVIDVEDEPKNGLFKVKGFNTLVFDKNGLNRLTPYPEKQKETTNLWKADPDKGERFYYISTRDGNVYETEEKNTAFTQTAFNLGNYFKTWEEAQGMRRYLLTRRRVMKYAEPYDRPWDGSVYHYYILYQRDKKIIDIGDTNCFYRPGEIYFKTRQMAQNAIDDIGKDYLIKYYFEYQKV